MKKLPKVTIPNAARLMASVAGFDPDEIVATTGALMKAHPRWTEYVQAALERIAADNAPVAASPIAPQAVQYQQAKLQVFGDHDGATINQMHECMKVGSVVGAVLCADGHKGYAQPVGGVIAYEDQISISGVGFDIGCGNLAVRLDLPYGAIHDRVPAILADIRKVVSFGIGRVNGVKAEHSLFDDAEAWRAADVEEYRTKAAEQLGTVGSGNHYVDLFREVSTDRCPALDNQTVWIGVHFGSRGLGHKSATKYLKAAGGRDGMDVPPAVVDAHSEIGQRYLAAMKLAGRYAYAGRAWVVEAVRKIVGGEMQDFIHNHHNYAWEERHGDRELWVVRKGATPAFPGQRGFVGGSMGDDAVIIEGVDSEASRRSLYSTIHGAGRSGGGRMWAKKTFTRDQMDDWLKQRGVTLSGGDLDESPMAYRRLPDVLKHHEGTIKVLHTLRPFGVLMAGNGEFDPFKD